MDRIQVLGANGSEARNPGSDDDRPNINGGFSSFGYPHLPASQSRVRQAEPKLKSRILSEAEQAILSSPGGTAG